MDIFEYEVDNGAVMDYLDHRFVLVIKEDDWNEEQLNLLKQPVNLSIGQLNGVLFFVAESGPVDSADFYFHPVLSDQVQELLEDLKARDTIDLDLYFLDEKNQIVNKRSRTLDQEASEKVAAWLNQAMDEADRIAEYESKVEKIQNLYEPFELAEQKAVIQLKM